MIRYADDRDISRIAELLVFGKRTAYRGIFNNDTVSFKELQVLNVVREYQDDPSLLKNTLLYDDGIVKGIIGKKYPADDPDGIELCDFYVEPVFQGTGIGRELIEHFIREAKAEKKKRIFLWVIKDNLAARRFYELNGFDADGEERLIEGTTVIDKKYVKQLSNDNGVCMEEIIEYLKKTYDPMSILLYGSYADGTNDESSDFDCMIIVRQKDKNHDDAVIGGVQLDCFIFTEEQVKNEDDADAFLTAYNSNIVLDNGLGAELKQRIHKYVEEHTVIPDDEKDFIRSWIQKTIHRIQKNDDEGNMRAVSFLAESLVDYFFLRDMFYFGSKKAIYYIKENDKEGYALFHKAVTAKANSDIIKWAEYIIR